MTALSFSFLVYIKMQKIVILTSGGSCADLIMACMKSVNIELGAQQDLKTKKRKKKKKESFYC